MRTLLLPCNGGAARGLRARSETSRSVSEPLALDAQQGLLGAHNVINAEPHSIVHAEIELCQVAVQMPFVDVLVDAHQTTLEQAEIALGGVGVDAPVVAVAGEHLAVVDCLMLAERHQAHISRPGRHVR